MQKRFKPNSAMLNENNYKENDYANPFLEEVNILANEATDPFQKHYIFIFSIELHSYLPISRKTLSSTFRKKKRTFRGQCQIYENFIRHTQFTKKFELVEV